MKCTAAAGAGIQAKSLAATLLQTDAAEKVAQALKIPEIDTVAVGLLRPHVIPLDGDWLFQEDPKELGEHEGWYRPRSIKARMGKVPLPWQVAYSPACRVISWVGDCSGPHPYFLSSPIPLAPMGLTRSSSSLIQETSSLRRPNQITAWNRGCRD